MTTSRTRLLTAAAATMLCVLLTSPGSAQVARFDHDLSLGNQSVSEVRYYRGYGYRGGYRRYGYRGYGYRGYGVGAAAVGAAAAYGAYGYGNRCYYDNYGQYICPQQYQYRY